MTCWLLFSFMAGSLGPVFSCITGTHWYRLLEYWYSDCSSMYPPSEKRQSVFATTFVALPQLITVFWKSDMGPHTGIYRPGHTVGHDTSSLTF